MHDRVLAGIRVVVARLDAQEMPPGRAALLPEAERAAAAALVRDIDRHRYLAAHVLLREELSRLRDDAVQFSQSRSHGVAAFAFASRRSVGIDIEAVRPVEEADAIAAEIFARREQRAYAAARDKVCGFLRGWTRTEALAKGLGRGLVLPRRALDAALDEGWVVHSFAPLPGFIAALAAAPVLH